MRRVSAFLRQYLLMILTVLILLAVVVVVWIFSAPIAQWTRSAQSFDAITFLGDYLLAIAILGGGLLVLALIWLPKWQATRPDLLKERFEAENEARKTLAEIVGGAALLVGLYFTWSSLEVSREGQITDRFTKSIEQLGNDKLQIRLGGIYALARIAGESKKDHWPIMEVLTAYVREHAPRPPKSPENTPPPKLATDIQAVLTVLRQRDRTYEKDDQRLDLSGTNLRGANLRDAQLERANLRDTQLEQANLLGAHLERAYLWGAHLERANLPDAQLQGAYLRDAQLERADLRGAHLEQANGLTVEQLSTVKTLYQAQLDPPLFEQIEQRYPHLLKGLQD